MHFPMPFAKYFNPLHKTLHSFHLDADELRASEASLRKQCAELGERAIAAEKKVEGE